MEIRSGTAKSTTTSTLYYEDMGTPGDPPVLLMMGLGAQLLLWRNGFCERLVDRGYRVIRYDNRDVGLSSRLDGKRADGGLASKVVRSSFRASSLPSTDSRTWPTTPQPCWTT